MSENLDLVIICPGMRFDGDTDGPLGGSETACRELSRALQRQGAHVTVFSDCGATKVCDGVKYMPIEQAQAYTGGTPHDVTIVQRRPEIFGNKTNSLLNVLWTHDLAMKRAETPFRAALWNIDQVFTVSEWHRQQMIETYDLPESLVYGTRNGIDPDLIALAREQAGSRDPNKLMYCARPERGLDVLAEKILPELLERNPDYFLCVATYGNVVPEMKDFYDHINKLLNQFGDSVQWLGELDKVSLYREYMEAGCYVYPTPSPTMPNFRETSCITAMECMACGLPFVTSHRGGLAETLGDYGVFAGEHAQEEDYIERFVDCVIHVEPREPVPAERLAWDGVASNWLSHFREQIAERNNDAERLGWHLLRHNDIEALRHLAAGGGLSLDLQSRLNEYDSVTADSEAYYNSLSKEWSDEVFNAVPSEPRFRQLSTFIGHLDPSRKRVLDWGCSYGGYLVNLANMFPDRTFYGVDFDRGALARAAELPAKHGNVYFYHVDDLPDNLQFHVAICTEVLEHVQRPWELIDQIEERVFEQGVIYLTVPHGPWEYGSIDAPEHLWNMSAHDLRDMLHEKEGVALTSMTYSLGYGPLSAPVGWWVVTYINNAEKETRPIDIDRHVRLQRPMQTVSAMMIAGGPAVDETLLWTLNSLRFLASEIVVVDCGISHEAYGMLIEKGARVIRNGSDAEPGPDMKIEPMDGTLPIAARGQPVDPKVIGFERARNMGLGFVTGDWVLWIDTDEKLVQPERLAKYLRENMYHGYGIQQHHFACDTHFDPDKPVRLFRNRPHEGKEIQFHGAVHEHPELELNGGPGPSIILADCHIAHLGYLSEPVRQKRFGRNYPLLELDQARNPDRVLQKSLLMRDKMILVRDLVLSHGGQVPEEARALCREVVELHQQHFLGKAVFTGSNPSKYYGQALEFLGEGITGEDLEQAGVMNVLLERHANVEDLIADIEHKVADHVAPRDHEYY